MKWMIIRDTKKKGRAIFAHQEGYPIHRYAVSGVVKLRKITAAPRGWRPFSSARKTADGRIWVCFSEDTENMLDFMWYPLLPYNESALNADDEYAEQMRRWARGDE